MSVWCIRLSGFGFIEIEIGIEIQIELPGSISVAIFLYAVTPAAQSTEHYCNTIQLNLSLPAR
jgi:hypothetical protein